MAEEFLAGLLKFYSDLINLFDNENIEPVLYGSLACAIHTGKDILIRDIDFIIEEKFFGKILFLLKRSNFAYAYSEKDHSIKVYCGDFRISFDSKEYWHGDLDIISKEINFKGFVFNLISLDQLAKIYKKSYELAIDKKCDYKMKYLLLLEIMNFNKL